MTERVEVGNAVPVVLVQKERSKELLEEHSAAQWAAACKFKAASGEVLLLPGGTEGGISKVLLGLSGEGDLWAAASLAKLPPGSYEVESGSELSAEAADKIALGFLLGCYKFTRYKTQEKPVDASTASETLPDTKTQLVWPETANRASVEALATAYYLARDLITTPAEDLGPQHVVAEVQALADAHSGATIQVVQGEQLLEENYPAIHTVGRASHRPPALVDLRWSPSGAAAADLPLLALVGKGVCFDSGGLDIKPAAGMKLMKKDMGGAAFMIALSHVVMTSNLPVRLRLLIPTVENSISGNAYRPLDVLQTRAGITVENGNTDAEGRLILCDALADAATENPDLLIDAATLTGAARVALGSEIPVVFSSDDEVWSGLEKAARQEEDPLWRLPLWKGYRKLLDSKVADISSTGSEAGAGSITAALYLQEFVKDVPRWVHIDMGAYNNSSRDGRPEGGEAQGLRALWAYLKQRYSTQA